MAFKISAFGVPKALTPNSIQSINTSIVNEDIYYIIYIFISYLEIYSCIIKAFMIIKDYIYRFIQVPSLSKHLIDKPSFQRLRNIKQLGLVHPNAVHTRFEHSLGLCISLG